MKQPAAWVRQSAGGMADKAAAAAQLAALHSQLAVLLPDLLRLEELLRSCLASHSAGTSELAPLLQQRLQQCGAAVTLLRGLPAGAAGREEEGVQALAAAKPFIESSAAMIQDVQVGSRGRGGQRARS